MRDFVIYNDPPKIVVKCKFVFRKIALNDDFPKKIEGNAWDLPGKNRRLVQFCATFFTILGFGA